MAFKAKDKEMMETIVRGLDRRGILGERDASFVLTERCFRREA